MNIKRRILVLTWLSLALPAFALVPPKISTPETAVPQDTATVEAGSAFVLGSWNMEWFPGHSPKVEKSQKQIDAVKKVLDEENPSIFMCYEIRGLGALKLLQLDYPYMACTNIPRVAEAAQQSTGALPMQEIGLLSKVPWKEVWTLDFSELPEAPERPPRGVLGVLFVLPNGRQLTVYGVHLKSNRGDAETDRMERESAIDYIEWDWQRRQLDPAKDNIVIMGDFNTSPNDPKFAEEKTIRRLLSAGFVNAAQGLLVEQRVTLPGKGKYPDNDFDHILISPSLRALMAGDPPWLKIVKAPEAASDHNALFLDVTNWVAPK
jgi:endonuclease/exonuclease/phosphatase family metal-dependent hydrolase